MHIASCTVFSVKLQGCFLLYLRSSQYNKLSQPNQNKKNRYFEPAVSLIFGLTSENNWHRNLLVYFIYPRAFKARMVSGSNFL